MKNLQIILSGKVYKVGLRYFIKQMAKHYSILGSVRYVDGNAIAIEARGEKENMDHFLKYCRLGCPGSDIQNVSIYENAHAACTSFEIIE